MKILVGVKRVIDPYVRIRVRPDNSGVETQHVKMSMNPFDEIAVEEAIRMREQNQASEVVVMSIGTDIVQDILRHALALGADRAILIKTDACLPSIDISHVFKTIVEKEHPDLVMLGKQSIDGDNNQTPQMLAAELGWPQATYASRIVKQNNTLEVDREVDAGLETIAVDLPAVVSVDLRLNTPRYASLPNIMKAKQKPLEVIPLEDLKLTFKKRLDVLSVRAPVLRREGIKVSSVSELLEKLTTEAKVLEPMEKK